MSSLNQSTHYHKKLWFRFSTLAAADHLTASIW